MTLASRISKLAKELRKQTGRSISIDLETWAHRSDIQEETTSTWVVWDEINHHKLKCSGTFKELEEFVDSFREELCS
jgi:hypothetical protein